MPTFWFVWTKPNASRPGTLRSPRKTFTSREKAVAAARIMASRNPGTKFFVASVDTADAFRVTPATVPGLQQQLAEVTRERDALARDRGQLLDLLGEGVTEQAEAVAILTRLKGQAQ